jgi:hypothetical protein
MRSLDLPRGRVAAERGNYERLAWLSQHTVRGEYFFTAAGTEFYFPLALRDAAEIPFVKTNGYTRPEQVQSTVSSLAKYRVRFVLSDSTLGFQGDSQSPRAPIEQPRGHLRQALHVIKTFLVGEDLTQRDNLGPLRGYVRAHYNLTKLFSGNLEVWERNPRP